MFTESLIVSLITFVLALAISFSVALLIKGIFTCIKYKQFKGADGKNAAWKSAHATSSK